MIHRDVNPSNIILLESGQVKVTDFGLSRLASAASSDVSQPGVFHGTLGYAPPEQILGQEIDGRSDIFSLGVILYEMLTGERPFQGKNITAVIHHLLSGKPLPLTALGPHLPRELKGILSKAMARDVTQRYQTCAELGQDLRRIISIREWQEVISKISERLVSRLTAPPSDKHELVNRLTAVLEQELSLGPTQSDSNEVNERELYHDEISETLKRGIRDLMNFTEALESQHAALRRLQVNWPAGAQQDQALREVQTCTATAAAIGLFQKNSYPKI